MILKEKNEGLSTRKEASKQSFPLKPDNKDKQKSSVEVIGDTKEPVYANCSKVLSDIKEPVYATLDFGHSLNPKSDNKKVKGFSISRNFFSNIPAEEANIAEPIYATVKKKSSIKEKAAPVKTDHKNLNDKTNEKVEKNVLPSTEVLLVKKEVLKLNPDHLGDTKSGDDEESNVTPCIPVNVSDIKADNNVQSNVTPNVKDCQAKATVRERTESVSSETSEDLPDLCPIENEVETDDEIPEIVVQIPEQNEAQDLTSDKVICSFK